jgi:hypothetical protein
MTDLDYVDHEDLQVTPEFINEVLQSDEKDWDEFEKWYEEADMPQGLQLIQIHMQPSLREWIVELLQVRDVPVTDETVVRCAIAMDSMFS